MRVFDSLGYGMRYKTHASGLGKRSGDYQAGSGGGCISYAQYAGQYDIDCGCCRTGNGDQPESDHDMPDSACTGIGSAQLSEGIVSLQRIMFWIIGESVSKIRQAVISKIRNESFPFDGTGSFFIQ